MSNVGKAIVHSLAHTRGICTCGLPCHCNNRLCRTLHSQKALIHCERDCTISRVTLKGLSTCGEQVSSKVSGGCSLTNSVFKIGFVGTILFVEQADKRSGNISLQIFTDSLIVLLQSFQPFINAIIGLSENLKVTY